ncbi:DUF4136 domain-containing protein [Aeromonas eucrenophila]|uniref:DUF4136 domain-containing protein n=1 Tax=Aeromonas eucrenophila TaxID=649 RepID=A0ABW0YD06_9GAMM|nr:DUF4136 domain-containing protein [Aeromonas eucrenophila]
MRGALLSLTLAALLAGCSTGPAAPTVETGTMVVRPADNWTYGTTPRYALAEQFQYAGNSAAGWLEPVQQAVSRDLNGKGWQSVPLDEADVWVAIGVAGSKDMSDGEIFARLGMTPGLQAGADARKGTLAIMLLDRKTQQTVWSSAIQLASDVPIDDDARSQLSQQLAEQLLGALPAR